MVTSLAMMTWRVLPKGVPSFRFGQDYDASITIYLTIVLVWFFAQQPPLALATLFFADPAGAEVGKAFTRYGLNRTWMDNKTGMGTTAVFVAAYLTLPIPTELVLHRVLVAAACAACEAWCGRTYDNAFIAIPAITSHLYFINGWR